MKNFLNSKFLAKKIGLFGGLIFGVVFLYNFSFAQDFVSPTSFLSDQASIYDSGYQNAYQLTPLTNVFGQANQVAQGRYMLAQKDSMTNISAKIQGLGGQNNCSIQDEDVLNVLLTTPVGIELKQKLDLASKKMKFPTNDDFSGSCMKIASCYGMSGQSLSVDTVIYCRNIVSQAYSKEIQKSYTNVNILKPITNPDIFFNDTIDNGSSENKVGSFGFNESWDLMSDFNSIHSLIFKDPKTKTQTDNDLFSTSPPAGGSCKKACGFDQIKDGVDKAILSMQTTFSKINNILNNTNFSDITGSKTNIEDLKTNIVTLQQSIDSNSTTFKALAQGSQVGSSESYKTPVGTGDEGGGSGEKIEFDGSDIQNNDMKTVGSGLSDTSSNVGVSANSLQGIIDTLDEHQKNNTPLSNDEITHIKASLSGTAASLQQQKNNLQSASSKTSALDKIVKLDTMLCVQVCWVDHKTTSSSDGGSVMSIEEIIDKYISALSDVKNSGAMMKQRVTDEFWETSFQDLKLKNLVNIDFIITTKPVFDNKTLSQKVTQQQAVVQNLKQGILNQSTNLGDSQENNKYLVLFDPKDRSMIQSPEKQVDTLQNVLQKQQERYSDLQQAYAQINMKGVNTNSIEKMSAYLDALDTFTQQMGVIFQTFSQTSKAFLENIMSGD